MAGQVDSWLRRRTMKLLVLIHRTQQPFETVFQQVLEAVEVDGVLHAVLQAVDVFAQWAGQVVGSAATFGMAFAGGLKIVLECLKTLIELFEISPEFMLAAVGNGQHQNRKIVEYW